ncbi:hexokinase [Geosmithia morbida]|uniref:Phosphotransferase n=1 Tax=Geosmithia morbida TaxID=1094350 RepID=A0A9P5D2Y3_9HYPO|nr:hexokinase [Geosmithia morbida]KAF4125598.1 hexokinase [Geosmithia morbida]
MASFRKVVLAAIIKSFLRGKTLLQAILTYWISPLSWNEGKGRFVTTKAPLTTVHEFLKTAETAFLGPVSGHGLNRLSADLKRQYLDCLESDMQCMLPSFNHLLPTGDEAGQYLAVDVGGSTLRVAVVELFHSQDDAGRRRHENRIVSIRSFFISQAIKDLEGVAFFDWMATRISETLAATDFQGDGPLTMALAWSFPIEETPRQTSLRSGRLLGMGKSFKASRGLVGQDLGKIIESSCKTMRLEVTIEAIINDSSACLLSQAYTHPSTRFSLILGTGFNVGAYLPTPLIGRRKFASYPAGWLERASHTIVNTELSMFGRNALSLTKWDIQLLDGHARPDFQPLEYMVSGMYLGEIARFALLEAIETTGAFGGIVPPSLIKPYSLGSDTLSMIEMDTSDDLLKASAIFSERHPSPHTPTTEDLLLLRSLATYISLRSSALVAAAVYTLDQVRGESHRSYVATLPESSPLRRAAEADLALDETVVAFNGSVIENYPNYLLNCQRYIDDLVRGTVGTGPGSVASIRLVPAKESSLVGAAVASACVKSNA